MKRTLSFLLSVIMTVTFLCSSVTVYAEETPTDNVPTIENDVSISGTNSFGNLLSEALTEESDRQEENNGYNVFSAEVTGNIVTVEYETLEDCTLLAAVYDEEGKTLLTSGKAEISKDETISEVAIETDTMPEYFYLRVFMIDSDDLSPMCTVYESPNYTKEMQEFFAKTIDDFDADKVLNLDNDKTNNFAVYSDGVKTITSSGTVNIFTTIDEENERYIIKNADDSVKSLKKDDIFVHEYDNGSLLIVDVGEISVDGTTVTITGQDTSIEEVFDYVKIDSTKKPTPSPKSLPSPLEPSNKTAIEESVSDGASAELMLVDKTFTDDEKNSVKLNGSVKFDATSSVKYYISLSYAYLEFKIDFSAKISVSVTGKINASIPFLEIVAMSPIPAISVGITPSFVFKATGKATIDATLTGTVGFKVSTNEGVKNLTTAKLSTGVAIEGTIFLGFSLEPKVKIMSDKIAKTSVIAQVGGEIKASYKKEIAGINTPESAHECKNCLDGDVSAKLDGSFNVMLANKWKFDFKLLNVTIKLFDFYYSFDFNEFGFGTCPHQKGNTSIYEGEIVQSGKCGDDATYEVYENGTLRIFGKGDLYENAFLDEGYFIKEEVRDKFPNFSINKCIIENGITSIGLQTFGYQDFETIVIPDSVTRIDDSAFRDCTRLTSIIIPNSITVIYDYAFAGCKNLKDVYYTGTVEEWDEIDFGCVGFYNATIHYNSTGAETQSFSPEPVNINAAAKANPLENLTPETIYNVYVFRSKDAENLLSADNLIYVMQFRADSSGNIAAPDAPDGETVVARIKAETVYGDANCDGKVNIADATAIVQSIGNGDKYALTEQGRKNADCYHTGDGVTGLDAMVIQQIESGIYSVTDLPIRD